MHNVYQDMTEIVNKIKLLNMIYLLTSLGSLNFLSQITITESPKTSSPQSAGELSEQANLCFILFLLIIHVCHTGKEETDIKFDISVLGKLSCHFFKFT